MARVFVFGDNIDTDVIIPARYLNVPDKQALAAHCMEDADKAFAGSVRPGDIIAAGRNFGCGSSREHAPIAIAACGVAAVVAVSFARIFYRNAINTGLMIIECDRAGEIRAADDIEIDPAEGRVINHTQNAVYAIRPHPPFIIEIIKAGGLVEYTKRSFAVL